MQANIKNMIKLTISHVKRNYMTEPELISSYIVNIHYTLTIHIDQMKIITYNVSHLLFLFNIYLSSLFPVFSGTILNTI